MQNRFKLTHWKIRLDFYKNYIADGKVYYNPKFRDGKEIHTSEILKLEEEKDCYVIYTLNSVYELPKAAYMGKNEEIENMKKHLSDIEDRMQSISKKVLSGGDCLLYDKKLLYYSEKGIIQLTRLKKEDKFIYEYPDENFSLEVLYGFSEEYIITGCKSDKNMMYIITSDSITKYTYKSLTSLRDNTMDLC